MKFGPGQKLRDQDFLDMEKQLASIFYDLVFRPLADILNKTSKDINAHKEILENADDISVLLFEALKRGKIQYAEGLFTGSFDARTSQALRKIGATFNKVRKGFALDPAKAAGWIKEASADYNYKVKAAHDSIRETLAHISLKVPQYVDAHVVRSKKTVDHVDAGFDRHAPAYGISVPISEHVKERLAEEYGENMKLWIRKWSDEAIMGLRDQVEQNALTGYRFERLVDVIKHRYGVAQTKAQFLARQETGLLMSKYRKHRFGEAGITHYKWRGSKDERERKDHRALEGKIFSYDSPPVTNKQTGARNNPGEDFNCRCVDEPLLTPIGLGVLG